MPLEIILYRITITSKEGEQVRDIIGDSDSKFGQQLDYDTKRALKYAGINISNKGFELKNYKFNQQIISKHGYSNY